MLSDHTNILTTTMAASYTLEISETKTKTLRLFSLQSVKKLCAQPGKKGWKFFEVGIIKNSEILKK